MQRCPFLTMVVAFFGALDTYANATLEAPGIRVETPTPHAVVVFITDQPCNGATRFTVEYRPTMERQRETLSVSTGPSHIYAARIDGLMANTEYEVRAGASELYESRNISAANIKFSKWITFRTGRLSIFGSVVLMDVPYKQRMNFQGSDLWNKSLAEIERAYQARNVTETGDLSIIRVENSGGMTRAHYRVKVNDSSLPSETDYTISGPQLNESYINNGDRSLGETYIFKEGNKWNLHYIPQKDNPCPKLVERYLMVSPDDRPTLDIHLNVASSEATTADEDNGLIIAKDGSLKRDDGITVVQLPPGTLLGLSPRFLIKDCLVNQTEVSLYSEVFEVKDAYSQEEAEQLFDMTEPPVLFVNTSDVTYASKGTSVTLDLPAIARAIKYEVLKAGNSVATLQEENIGCSDRVKITVDSLTSGKTYNFSLRVTVRYKDGSKSSATSTSPISVTTADSSPNFTFIIIIPVLVFVVLVAALVIGYILKRKRSTARKRGEYTSAEMHQISPSKQKS